jgi:hypothetical protein
MADSICVRPIKISLFSLTTKTEQNTTIPSKPRQSRSINNETTGLKEHICRETSQTPNASTNKDQSMIDLETDDKSDDAMSDSYCSTTTTEDSGNEPET